MSAQFALLGSGGVEQTVGRATRVHGPVRARLENGAIAACWRVTFKYYTMAGEGPFQMQQLVPCASATVSYAANVRVVVTYDVRAPRQARIVEMVSYWREPGPPQMAGRTRDRGAYRDLLRKLQADERGRVIAQIADDAVVINSERYRKVILRAKMMPRVGREEYLARLEEGLWDTPVVEHAALLTDFLTSSPTWTREAWVQAVRGRLKTAYRGVAGGSGRGH